MVVCPFCSEILVNRFTKHYNTICHQGMVLRLIKHINESIDLIEDDGCKEDTRILHGEVQTNITKLAMLLIVKR